MKRLLHWAARILGGLALIAGVFLGYVYVASNLHGADQPSLLQLTGSATSTQVQPASFSIWTAT
jgi:hypothetical protein